MENEILSIPDLSQQQKLLQVLVKDNKSFILPYPGKDETENTCWSDPPGDKFYVRGNNYLLDNIKYASDTLVLETITCRIIATSGNEKIILYKMIYK